MLAQRPRRLKTILFFLALVVYAGLVAWFLRSRYVTLTAPDTVEESAIIVKRPPPSPPAEPPPPPSSSVVPTEKLLDVPFLVQAPFGNWDELHGEACEEASLMMVKYFRAGQKFTSLAAADQEIKDLIAWQTEHGYKVDVSVSQLSQIASDYYNLTSGRVINNPTVEDIKKEVAAGRPVIVPAAGRQLGNPYFTAPGPPYHMLVVRGYTATEFITNDPGTKRGEQYRYPYQRFMEAIHDWTGSVDTITTGEKKVLVFD